MVAHNSRDIGVCSIGPYNNQQRSGQADTVPRPLVPCTGAWQIEGGNQLKEGLMTFALSGCGC